MTPGAIIVVKFVLSDHGRAIHTVVTAVTPPDPFRRSFAVKATNCKKKSGAASCFSDPPGAQARADEVSLRPTPNFRRFGQVCALERVSAA
jgi:hypothetical protein